MSAPTYTDITPLVRAHRQAMHTRAVVLGVVAFSMALFATGLTLYFTHIAAPAPSPQAYTLPTHAPAPPGQQTASGHELPASTNVEDYLLADPRQSLQKLRDAVTQHPSLARSCHGIAHELGHEFYKKYQDFSKAINTQDDICGSGYIHGVIEEHLGDLSDEALLTRLAAICEPAKDGRCYHGVGHGIMFATGSELDRSLEYCSVYKTDPSARANCSDGVFMQYYGEGDISYTTDVTIESPRDLATLCDGYDPTYRSSCYYYAPRNYLSKHPESYATLARLCAGVETSGDQQTCFAGMGAILVKTHLDDPPAALKHCASGTTIQKDACIGGMLSYYNVHYALPSDSPSLCSALGSSSRQCELIAERRALQPVSTSRDGIYREP